MDDKLLQELNTVFKNFPNVNKAMLFGSRARGDNTEKSDYDIAVFGNLSAKDKSKLRYICAEELYTLHKIDLVFMTEKLDEKFIANVNKEGIVFYGKT